MDVNSNPLHPNTSAGHAMIVSLESPNPVKLNKSKRTQVVAPPLEALHLLGEFRGVTLRLQSAHSFTVLPLIQRHFKRFARQLHRRNLAIQDPREGFRRILLHDRRLGYLYESGSHSVYSP
jgi:hypothetical protein